MKENKYNKGNNNKYNKEIKEAKTPKEKKRLSKKTKWLLGIGIPVGAILLLVLALYIVGSIFYGRLYHDPADTTVYDDEALAALLEEDINAACEGYTEEAINRVRSSIVLSRIDALPFDVDYKEILAILKEDINADLSAYEDVLNEEERQEISVVRWAVHYEYADAILDREPPETGDGTGVGGPDYTLPPLGPLDTPGETETNTPETGETTGPDGETTGPETDVTTPSETDTPTDPPATTAKPKPTNPPVTTPVDPTVSIVIPGTEPTPETWTGEVTDADVYNLLVIGVDTNGGGFSGRSDTIMVISINKVTKKIILTSFMRDTVIHDPETKGYAKINNFYARSASSVGQRAGRLMNALKHNFGMNINNYVVINFKVFNKIIDVFGGVDVPLYYSEYLDLKWRFENTDYPIDGLDSYFDSVKGGKKTGYINVHLNSQQALIYARLRKNLWNPVSKTYQRSDDSWRTERQRNVVMDLVRQMRGMSFDELMKIADEVFPMVATGISYNEFLSLAASHMDYAKYTMENLNASNIRYSWYPCTFTSKKVYFQGDKGYGTGSSGVGILEAPYRDGYKLIHDTWRKLVYGS